MKKNRKMFSVIAFEVTNAAKKLKISKRNLDNIDKDRIKKYNLKKMRKYIF